MYFAREELSRKLVVRHSRREMTLDPHPSALRLEHAKHRGDARFTPDPALGLVADHHVEGRVLLSGETRERDAEFGRPPDRGDEHLDNGLERFWLPAPPT